VFERACSRFTRSKLVPPLLLLLLTCVSCCFVTTLCTPLRSLTTRPRSRLQRANGEKAFVHTLNATAIAVRALRSTNTPTPSPSSFTCLLVCRCRCVVTRYHGIFFLNRSHASCWPCWKLISNPMAPCVCQRLYNTSTPLLVARSLVCVAVWDRARNNAYFAV
jgi:hypothetical protein